MNHTLTFKIQQHISDGLRNRFQEYKRKERHHGKRITISGYANDLIQRALDHEYVMQQTTPEFKVIGDVEEGKLHVRDNENSRVFTVIRERKKFKCIEDDSTNCNHAIVAMNSPEAIGFFMDETSTELTEVQRMVRKTVGNGDT